jgi:hypothetical protein
VPIRNFHCLCFCLACCLIACQERSKSMSFYYWQRVFALDSTEEKTLQDNSVRLLYIRYFDVDWSPADTVPVTAGQLSYQSSPAAYTVIPVICFQNRVFEQLSPADIPSFTAGIFTRVRMINASRRLQTREIQFDCDWTEKTKDNYFSFLREYHRISVQTISTAIRLYQLKYPDRTGIPPVDHGVLLYFNMVRSDTGDEKSLYERSVVHRYTPSLRSYPMTLDVALPIFPGIKNTKDEEDLMEIVTDINQHSNHHIRDLIFFDLQQQNIQQFDSNVFKEVLEHAD